MTRKSIVIALLAAVVMLVGLGAKEGVAQKRTVVSNEKITMWEQRHDKPSKPIVFGPDGRSAAYVIQKNQKYSKCVPVLDGREKMGYDFIYEPIAVSKNSRFAYRARTSGSRSVGIIVPAKEYMVRNGFTGKAYDEVGEIVFSPDGKNSAYTARARRKMFVVMEDDPNRKNQGKGGVLLSGDLEQRQYEYVDQLVFSPNGARFGYLAIKEDNKAVAVIDGVESPAYDMVANIAFSPDGKQVAYWIKKDNLYHVWNDGKEGAAYKNGGTIFFSPSGKRMAYPAQKDDKWVMVVDGKEMAAYDNIGNPFFSPDSKRVAYSARNGDKWTMVVDGKETGAYDYAGTPVFSPSGKRLAYKVIKAGSTHIVADGKEGAGYQLTGTPVFSPDSKRLAYLAGDTTARKFAMVVDGVEGERYTSIDYFTFSPDSKRVAYWAFAGSRWVVVVDNTTGPAESDGYVLGFSTNDISPIVFESPTRIRYMATNIRAGDWGLYRVIESLDK